MRAILAVVVLLMALPADAQSLRQATETFAVAATADWMSTRAMLKRGSTEANPMLRWAESKPDALIAIGATADVIGVWIWNRKVGKKRPKLAAIGLYAISAVRVWLTVRNMREPDYRQPPPWGGVPTHPTPRNPFARSPGRF